MFLKGTITKKIKDKILVRLKSQFNTNLRIL